MRHTKDQRLLSALLPIRGIDLDPVLVKNCPSLTSNNAINSNDTNINLK